MATVSELPAAVAHTSRLSDGSVVDFVDINVPEALTVRIACLDKKHALKLADLINQSAYIEAVLS